MPGTAIKPKKIKTKEIMKEIKDISKSGGFGSIVGRNSFQRPFEEGISLMKDIMNIYKES